MNGSEDREQLIRDLFDEVDQLKTENASLLGRIAELEDEINDLHEKAAGASV